MVACVAAFMEVCYLIRQDEISFSDLDAIDREINRFHHLRQVFIDAGVRVSISLPRQHALTHYSDSIVLFGSPNGLCSSITEAKHIKAVKEPWRRSSRNKPLPQMLETVMRMEKMHMAALRTIFSRLGMLRGSTSAWEAGCKQAVGYEDPDAEDPADTEDNHNATAEQAVENRDVADVGASNALNLDICISLAVRRRMCSSFHVFHIKPSD
jgi:hypothetical protein